MKRLAYIVILSAAVVLLIVLLDVISTKEEQEPEEFIVEETPETGAPAAFHSEDVVIPRYKNIPTKEGGTIKVQTVSFRIDILEHESGNRFVGRGIHFTLYDGYAYEKPLEERIIAKGRSDRATMYSEGEDVVDDLDIKFKEEIVLDDNVEIDSFDPRNPFSLRSDNLIYFHKEGRLNTKGPVRIFNDDTSIEGEDLFFDMNSLDLTIRKNIEVEGRDFTFSRTFSTKEPVDEPSEGESTKEKPPSPLKITASGSESGPPGLHLHLAQTAAKRADFGGPAEGAGEEEPLNLLTFHGDVSVIKDDVTLHCDDVEITFKELADGSTEVRTFRAQSKGDRTRIHKGEEGYTVICDDFFYDKEGGQDFFRILGRPVIENVSVPLLSETSEPDAPTKLLFRCGGALNIETVETSVPDQPVYEVVMEKDETTSERVYIHEANDPDTPLLEADRVQFTVSMGKGAGTPDLNRFTASGDVTGRMQGFDFECTDFLWKFEETPQGEINMLTLLDPESCFLRSPEFTLESPQIEIILYPDLTEIKAFTTFLCTSALESLPRFGSLDLLSGEKPEKAVPPDSERGEVKIQGEGEFLRFLVRDREGESSRDITISEAPSFQIHVFRVGQKKEEAIAIDGTHSFSLGILNGELKSLKLEEGRELRCPEMNFSALGDYLNLESRDSGGFAFQARADEGPATVSLSQPDSPEVCTVRAGDIGILMGGDTRLEAEGDVEADIPLAWFQKEESLEEGGSSPRNGITKMTGILKINSDTLVFERPEGQERFLLDAEGNAMIRREEDGLVTESDTLSYDSESEILSLHSAAKDGTVVRVRPEKDGPYNTVKSRTLDIDLGGSTAKVYRGGTIVFHTPDKALGAYNRLEIQCDNEIALTGSLLEFNGPVYLDYRSASGEEHRTMTCGRLWVNFVRDPFIATVFTRDAATYRSMIETGASGPENPDENAIKRIKAQDDVVLNFEIKSDKYVARCALLTWNILTDNILCDGLGEIVEITIKDNIIIRGSRIRACPVKEEIEILNR